MFYTVLTNFLKSFIIKYFTSKAMERVALFLIGELADRTNSRITKGMHKAIFEEVNKNDDEV